MTSPLETTIRRVKPTFFIRQKVNEVKIKTTWNRVILNSVGRKPAIRPFSVKRSGNNFNQRIRNIDRDSNCLLHVAIHFYSRTIFNFFFIKVYAS